MVHLVLSSTKGNQGLRYFPHSGYLGLTPVKVEGVVRTKVDDDLKLLQATSLTVSVRCYESRIGRVSVIHSNVLVDYTQVLWSKPHPVASAPIGDLEFPFRITIPAKVAGFSTSVFVDYRCMWRVEAVLNHAPIPGVGSRQIKHFELPLVRYDLPRYQPMPPHPQPRLDRQTTKLRAPTLRYSMHPPTSPIGPLDLASIPIFLLPLDAAVSIRSASVIVERRIQLNETLGSSTTPSTSTSPSSTSRPSSSSHMDSYSPTSTYLDPSAESSSTASTITPNTIYPSDKVATRTFLSRPSHPSPQPLSEIPTKIVINPVAGAESSGKFSIDENGVWSKTMTLQWPAAKSGSLWAIGETIRSDLVSVRFFVCVKIVVSSPSGTESIQLEDRELLIVSTNEAERQLAVTKYNDFLYSVSTARSKSKSPRRTRRGDDRIASSSEPAEPANSAYSYKGIGAPSKNKTSQRRPHTSAGPRDKTFNFSGIRTEITYGRARETREQQEVEVHSSDSFWKRNRDRPDTGSSSANSGKSGKGYTSPRISAAQSGSSSNATLSSSSLSTSSHEESDEMREWEEELARIEVQSRRSSDMLGFAGKRKRSIGVPRVETSPLL